MGIDGDCGGCCGWFVVVIGVWSLWSFMGEKIAANDERDERDAEPVGES